MPVDAKKSYRKQITRIGVAMLIFLGCTLLRSVLYLLAEYLVADMRTVPRIVVLSLIEALLYSAMFLVPAFVLKRLIKKAPHQPINTSFAITRSFPLYLFATIAIVFAAGELNALLTDFFVSAPTTPSAEAVILTQNFEIILMVITTAVVPAFVEEYLFRGVVLGAMRPFGRTPAIVVSALCFALMHGNAAQFLYTFVAGLVLGFVYCELKSIWAPVIIHFCNNFISITQTVFIERMEQGTGIAAVYLLRLIIVLLGVASVLYLILHSKDRKRELFENGCFEKEAEPDPEFAELELSRGERLRLFLAPTMVVFVVLSALSVFGALMI